MAKLLASPHRITSRRVLVTGAAGRLGANVVRQLLAAGIEVKALILPDDPKRSKLDGLNLEIVYGDLRDPSLSAHLVQEVDAIVHTANILGPPPGVGTDTFFDINARGTLFLIEAAAERASDLHTFVHISSDAIYPMGNHLLTPCYQPVDEAHPKRPNRLYALTKMINESTLDCYRRSHGLRTVVLRPAGMFAGEEILGRWTVGFVQNLLRNALARPESGLFHPDLADAMSRLEAAATNPEQLCIPYDAEGRSWLYSPADAQDVAHACLCALASPEAEGEAFNIALPQPLSFEQVARYLCDHTGQSICQIDLPVRWVYWSDISKAKARLGYRPQGTLARVMDTALAHRAGEVVDVVPA